MARIGKKLVRDRISTGCERKTLLDLHAGAQGREARARHAMPEPHPPWADIAVLRKAGKEWEERACAALLALLGSKYVRCEGARPPFGEQKLADVLALPEHPRWAIECTVPIEGGLPGEAPQRFAGALAEIGEALEWEDARMDLVGFVARRGPDTAVTAEGGVARIGATGPKTGLEIVEIKRSEHAGTAALCEVAWYAWAVAAMLRAQGLDNDVYVRAQASVWATHGARSLLEGSRGGSRERTEKLMRSEWTTAPMGPLLARLRHFMAREGPHAVGALAGAWRETLAWKIGAHCTRCEWLGPKELDEEDARAPSCRGEASARKSLAQIAGMTPVVERALREIGVETVADAADLDPNGAPARASPHLRRHGARIAERARALRDGRTQRRERCDASAEQQPDAQVHIHLHAEWDRSSGLTAGLAWRAVSVTGVRDPAGHKLGNHTDELVTVCEGAEPEQQEHALEQWLKGLNTWAREVDIKRAGAGVPSWPGAQVHVWSEAVAEHLTERLQQLDPARAKGAGRKFIEGALAERPNAAMHIVNHDIESMLAAPIPFRYSLRRVNEAIANEEREDAGHSPALGHEDLDDRLQPRLIQALLEKASEVAARKRKRSATLRLGEVLRARVRAVHRAARWTGRNAERTAPGTSAMMELGAVVARAAEMAPDLRVLVDDAAAERRAEAQERWRSWMRPVAEREGAHDCIRTEGALEGEERAQALAAAGVEDGPETVAVRIAEHSVQSRRHEREHHLVLIPESAERNAHRQARRLGAPAETKTHRKESVGGAYEVDVALIERNRRWLVATLPKSTRAFRRWAETLEGGSLHEAIAGKGRATLEQWASPWDDSSLEEAAEQVGRPHISRTHPIVGEPTSREHNTGEETSLAQLLLWGPSALGRTKEQLGEGDRVGGALAALAGKWPLDKGQKDAVEVLRKQRLGILWGPPGTGKTHTLASAVAAKIHATAQRGALLRVALCGPTWTAIEELARACEARLARLGCAVNLTVLKRKAGSNGGEQMHQARTSVGAKRTRPALVAGTEHQIARLRRAQARDGEPTDWIDWLVFDEASQCTVATLVRSAPSLSEAGSVSVAGDPLQMRPVRARAPEPGQEAILGPLYNFYGGTARGTGAHRGHHGMRPVKLERCYRANAGVVRCTKAAGYDHIEAVHPERSLVIEDAAEDASDPWVALADAALVPGRDIVCIRHDEGGAMQESRFEAQCAGAIAARAAQRLRGIRNAGDAEIEMWREADDRRTLLEEHLGVVSPHRAQGALIRSALERSLNPDGDPEVRALITQGVDTVERYQGQERSIMIVSFAAGDEHGIRDEEAFLISLHRLNVAISRARAKAIVLIDEVLATYLPSEPERIEDMGYLRQVAGGQASEKAIECRLGERTIQAQVRWHHTAPNAGQPHRDREREE